MVTGEVPRVAAILYVFKTRHAIETVMPRTVSVNSRDPHVRTLGASPILATLGPEWFVEFPAVPVTGHVVWCNFELARAVGFDVPASNRMTPRFHQQLIDALSYRAVPSKAAAAGRQIKTLYADRYGGEGLGPALGSGRSGFAPYGNLYIKGVGLTPLFRHDDPDDLPHNHGGVQMNHCLGEAVFGEVNHHLFTHGSSRILAIIDQGEYVVYRRGVKVPIALEVRCGMQLRPGHLQSSHVRRRRSVFEAFIRMTEETNQLVMRNGSADGRAIPDIKATMLRVVDDRARTSAEQFRWRMIHGAVTSSNMELSGATLDLATQSAQPRTAPVCFRRDYDSLYFGREHIVCATELRAAYRALVNSIPRRQRIRLNARSFNFIREMDQAYARRLQPQLVAAAGLKSEVAERLAAEHADLARRFTSTVTAMGRLRNPGDVQMAKRVVEHVSVVDVFNLLREYPRRYFDDPTGAHAAFIRAALNPVFKGDRDRVARTRAAVRVLIRKFDRVYRQLMSACRAYALEYYGSAATMQASITSRAAFENEPIGLYRSTLYDELEAAIATYKSTGDVDVVRTVIEKKVRRSLRRVDALLVQGRSRRLSDGGCEIEMQTIDGVNYSIRAWNDRRQRRSLHVSVSVEQRDNSIQIQLPGWPRVTPRHIGSLRYRFTTDGWVTSRTVGVRLQETGDGGGVITCDGISDLPLIGRLEGTFSLRTSRDSWLAHEGPTCTGYTFAVPDKQELARLMTRLPEPR